MKQVYELILSHLKEADIAPVYALGAHKGIIDGKVIVVKPASAMQYMNYSTTVQYFEIACYGRTASEVIDLLDEVQEAMKGLMFTVMPTYMQSVPYYDSNVKSWEIGGTYRNFVKN